MDNRADPLRKITPDNLKTEVASNLDIPTLRAFSQVSKLANVLFKEPLLRHLFNRIKIHLIRCESAEVEALLKVNPAVLFTRTDKQVVCFASIKMRPTLLQIARLLADMDMCKVIINAFDRVEDGKAAAKEQLEVLPDKLIGRAVYNFKPVVDAILSRKNLKKILQQFRTDIDKIVKEKGFPIILLLYAYELHDANYSNWDDVQLNIFCINVIGYLQRKAPAWLKKELAAGLANGGIAEGQVGSFVLVSKQSIDSLDEVPGKGVGYNYCVNMFGSAALRIGKFISYPRFHDLLLKKQKFLTDVLTSEKNAECELKPTK